MSRRILLINGPNLNLLGRRKPHIYGKTTLAEVEEQARTQAASHGIELETFQSNHEDGAVQKPKISVIIINPGALTHTSVAVRDALLGVDIPFVEVHVSNVHSWEAFRKQSHLSGKAVAVVRGMGVYGVHGGS
ncbi:Dehydroquinase [Chaetomium strumarium]|uniref:Catabolic 3-dehydroquinase n=1 Tax=Chaetomium strumarium TaxID=1170767 RepID=A0AAJ0GSS9_9PEZI|nr:Dehydroquinase [Chaetomium strumarium]